jgi:16S rRNA (guanine1207-N2)-methyltransferase
MSRPDHDSKAALDTLVYALQAQPWLIDTAQRIGFIHAQAHPDLLALAPRLHCEQSFRPQAARLEAQGIRSSEHKLSGTFDTILLLPQRQREQTLADTARALDLLKPGGHLVISLHNDWGAKRLEKTVKALFGEAAESEEAFSVSRSPFSGSENEAEDAEEDSPTTTSAAPSATENGKRKTENASGMISKHHCRVFWTTKTAHLQENTLAQWRAHGPLRRVLEGRFWSRPGLFSWDRIDLGSQLLSQHLPEDLKGSGADLGAGWGYLSDQLLRKCPDIDALDLYEAERDALDAAKRNLGLVMVRVKQRFLWHDVTQGIGSRKYDFIVMNPPFHEGRQPDPRLGMKFIAAASAGLKPHGQLWLVANRQLPYEGVLAEAFSSHRLVIQDGNFKVLTASGPLLEHPSPSAQTRLAGQVAIGTNPNTVIRGTQ